MARVKPKWGSKVALKIIPTQKFRAEIKDENAIKVIKEGLVDNGKKKMDPYGEKLSDEEIKALVAHIRTFKK